jgi:molybdopterin molybdotransferase
MQEDVRACGDIAEISVADRGKRHIRAAGSDFAMGDVLAPAGLRLSPQALIAVAAADAPTVSVFARPRVSVIGTGDELVQPGEAGARLDAVPESVTLGAAALAKRWGAEVTRRIKVSDELNALRAAADEALEDSDIVVVAGGASVGERDFAKAMFEHAGLEIVIAKVAMRPGKPIWLGRSRERVIVGLPGNPSAAIVTARLFLAPLIAAAAGGAVTDALRWRRAPLAVELGAGDERETFVKARQMPGGVAPCDNQDSSAQASLVSCDVLIRRRSHAVAGRVGAEVEVLDL